MRFTIEIGRWYSCQFIGNEFIDSLYAFSPIKVVDIEPLNSGSGIFKLNFYHANYPEGVQDKEYTLRTIERETNFILAKSTDHTPSRILYIQDISVDWITRYFSPVKLDGDLQSWLDNNL